MIIILGSLFLGCMLSKFPILIVILLAIYRVLHSIILLMELIENRKFSYANILKL